MVHEKRPAVGGLEIVYDILRNNPFIPGQRAEQWQLLNVNEIDENVGVSDDNP
jgi:hypothetical protein